MVTDFKTLISLCENELNNREYVAIHHGKNKEEWDNLAHWMELHYYTDFSEAIGFQYCDETLGTHIFVDRLMKKEHNHQKLFIFYSCTIQLLYARMYVEVKIMIDHGSGTLRELIRVLVRNLGMLEKSDATCCGVTITQCHAIVEIGRADKLSLVDLADLLDVDKSTMSRNVNNLVEAGLALRDMDTENRRYVVIQLTDDGRDVFKSIEKSMETYYKDIFSSIPEDKRGQVLESLALLTEAAKNNKCC